MTVAGTYNVTTKTPMGPQEGTFTVIPGPDGTTFTGKLSNGLMGELDVPEGQINGNTLTWQMKMTSPMPMTLDCTATIDGDQLTGSVTAGMFGSMEISGVRV